MIRIYHRFKVLSVVFILSMMQVSVAQAQTCVNKIPKTTPAADFTVHNDGTVTHNPTGLMWKVCSEGQTWQSSDGSCSGTATTHNWSQALQVPQALNSQSGFADYRDWRLPKFKELASIAELACHSPAINTTIFNDAPSTFYWSASPSANNSYGAWGVYFGYGERGYVSRSHANLVRLVRNGQ